MNSVEHICTECNLIFRPIISKSKYKEAFTIPSHAYAYLHMLNVHTQRISFACHAKCPMINLQAPTHEHIWNVYRVENNGLTSYKCECQIIKVGE